MKSTLLFLPLLALASAHLFPRSDTTSTISSSTPPTTTLLTLSPTATCLAACAPGDVTCKAACVGAAHPNSSQVSETNDCAAKCPQGDGSVSASDAYAKCLQACISSYYPTSQTVGPVGGGGASGSITGNGAAATGPSGSRSSSATPTGSAAATSASKAAAANSVPLVGSAGGLVGLFMAIFAL